MIKLTKYEERVMNILWNSEEPMIASAIAGAEEGMKLPTVRGCIKKLLDKKCIEPAGVVYSGTVLSQSYRPIISRDDYVSDAKLSISALLKEDSVFAYYLNDVKDMETLNRLEKAIKQRMEELEKQ